MLPSLRSHALSGPWLALAAARRSVHAVATSGFTAAGAAAYAAGRPEWQRLSVDAALDAAGVFPSLGVARSACGGTDVFPPNPVVELGAGTGKFTTELLAALRARAPRGAVPHVLAVEPSPGFRADRKSVV